MSLCDHQFIWMRDILSVPQIGRYRCSKCGLLALMENTEDGGLKMIPLGFSQLTWTTEKPRKPGWYWYRGPGTNVVPASVDGCNDLRYLDVGLHNNVLSESDSGVPVGEIPGEWAGPLEPPA